MLTGGDTVSPLFPPGGTSQNTNIENCIYPIAYSEPLAIRYAAVRVR
jgi:hypothetical protein